MRTNIKSPSKASLWIERLSHCVSSPRKIHWVIDRVGKLIYFHATQRHTHSLCWFNYFNIYLPLGWILIKLHKLSRIMLRFCWVLSPFGVVVVSTIVLFWDYVFWPIHCGPSGWAPLDSIKHFKMVHWSRGIFSSFYFSLLPVGYRRYKTQSNENNVIFFILFFFFFFSQTKVAFTKFRCYFSNGMFFKCWFPFMMVAELRDCFRKWRAIAMTLSLFPCFWFGMLKSIKIKRTISDHEFDSSRIELSWG